ncbi:monovalent cation/H(+) antiporter subunit G [Azovibrio restrictus]|uniref:monovalent cation/H(+) antiporter subunit G n=1 Tax=Azovibrio restrictus TaxID=146938 RepID=UPI0026EADC3F|nr:monovalent cation/H(+) antiporter subunit G [Azovibrio restrictus]
MNNWDNLPLWASLPATLLLILGGCIALTGCLGLMRLPHFYQRIHGPAITITLGTACILMASMILFSALETRPVVHELLITLFVLMTAPMVSMLIMRAAVHRELRQPPPNPPREESAWNAYGSPRVCKRNGGPPPGS